MVRKGNLAVFESSNISETKEATPIKIGVHAFDKMSNAFVFDIYSKCTKVLIMHAHTTLSIIYLSTVSIDT